MRTDVSNLKDDWLVDTLPSFDLLAAARYDLRAMQFDEDRIEEMVAQISPEFRKRWDEFVSEANPGDVLWWFRSPRETWNDLAGRAGFAIVRDGVPVSAFVTWKS